MRVQAAICFLLVCTFVNASNYFIFPDFFAHLKERSGEGVDESLLVSSEIYEQVKLAYESGDMDEIFRIYDSSVQKMLSKSNSIDPVSSILVPAYILYLNDRSN